MRAPTATDGTAVNGLIRLCPPLDTNSIYCNLLQCTHFANTSVIAEIQATPVGFISAYLIPDQPNTLFIWQLAICESTRGQGLASKMLVHLLARENLGQIQYIETTITKQNTASWKFFERFAKTNNCQLVTKALFDKTIHFDDEHESEILVKIGPLPIDIHGDNINRENHHLPLARQEPTS